MADLIAKPWIHVPNFSLFLLPRDDAPHHTDNDLPTDMSLQILVHMKSRQELLDLCERSAQVKVLKCLQKDGWVVLKKAASTKSQEDAMANKVENSDSLLFDFAEENIGCS